MDQIKDKTKDQPKLTKDQPKDQQKLTKDQPKDKPKLTKDQPKDQQKLSKDQPKDQPKLTKDQPKLTKDQPKDQPKLTKDQQKLSKDQPKDQQKLSKDQPKDPNTKYFLFKCGPTGSGKSMIETEIDKYLKEKTEITDNIFTHKDTVNLSIDDLIEKNPYFKEKVDLVFKKLFDKHKLKIKRQIKKEEEIIGKTRKDKVKSIQSIANEHLIKIIIEHFDNPSKEIIDELNVIYQNARINTSCVKGNTYGRITRQTAKTIKDSCENLRDELLKKALDENKNIVFERTGKDFPTKLFKKFPKIAEYNIIFSWSVVNICELLHRNKDRVIKKLEKYFKIKDDSPIKYSSISDFLKSKILPIPRLPDTNEIKYKKALLDIINTFNIYFYNKNNYRQIVIDNNYEPLIVYDNKYNNPTEKANPLLRYNIDDKC